MPEVYDFANTLDLRCFSDHGVQHQMSDEIASANYLACEPRPVSWKICSVAYPALTESHLPSVLSNYIALLSNVFNILIGAQGRNRIAHITC